MPAEGLEMFNSTTIEQIAKQFKEPRWMTELRHQALGTYARLPWPHASDDVWRRTDASLLDPTRDFSLAKPTLLQSICLTESEAARITQPLGDEQLIVRANGAWLIPPPSSE